MFVSELDLSAALRRGVDRGHQVTKLSTDLSIRWINIETWRSPEHIKPVKVVEFALYGYAIKLAVPKKMTGLVGLNFVANLRSSALCTASFVCPFLPFSVCQINGRLRF